MKRMMAAVVALMMLIPCLAIGEVNHYTLRFSWDEEQVAAWLQEAGVTEGSVLKVIGLIAGLRGEAYETETDGAFSLSLNGSDILKGWIRLEENDSMLLLVDGVPETAVKIPAEEDSSAAGLILQETDALSLVTVAMGLPDVCAAWLNSLPCRVEYGLFMGDAFSGGDEQHTWEISANDITVLLLRMTQKLDELAKLNPEKAEDYRALKQDLQDAVLRDALTGKESMILRKVLRDGKEIGVSATVFQDGEQVMTLSAGLEDPDALRIVAGIGLGGNVYYADAVLSMGESSGESSAINYSVRFYQDPHHDGFPGASVEAENSLGLLEGSLAASIADSSLKLGNEATLTRDGTPTLREAWEITLDMETGLLNGKDALYIGESLKPAFEIFLDAEKTEDFPAAEWPDSEPIPADGDSEALTAWSSQLATAVGYKLIFAVPTDVLMLLFR